jgi:hypothetical protein
MPKNSKQRSKEYRERDPQRAIEKAIRYRKNLREEVLTHYGNGKCVCVKCEFSDIRALTLDHIEAIGYERECKTSGALYSKLRRDHYPPGYQTLCMNCQFIKRHESHECARPFWRFPPEMPPSIL